MNTKIFFSSILFLSACSTSKVVMNDPEFSSHHSIDFEQVRFRRPATPIYDGETVIKPGTKDAAGNLVVETTRPLGNLDCESSENFFGRMNLSAIRSCLASAKPPGNGKEMKPFELEWNLRREGQPVLELRHAEEAPECFRKALAEIPFPRELVYVAPTDSPLRGECYTSRLALDSGELLGWELPRARIRLRVTFPLRENPKTDRDVERLLRTWTLSIYRGGKREEGEFHGRFLPLRYCLKCLGISENPERGAPTIPPPVSLWPFPEAVESVR